MDENGYFRPDFGLNSPLPVLPIRKHGFPIQPFPQSPEAIQYSMAQVLVRSVGNLDRDIFIKMKHTYSQNTQPT